MSSYFDLGEVLLRLCEHASTHRHAYKWTYLHNTCICVCKWMHQDLSNGSEIWIIHEGNDQKVKDYNIPGSGIGRFFNALGAVETIVVSNNTGFLPEIQVIILYIYDLSIWKRRNPHWSSNSFMICLINFKLWFVLWTVYSEKACGGEHEESHNNAVHFWGNLLLWNDHSWILGIWLLSFRTPSKRIKWPKVGKDSDQFPDLYPEHDLPTCESSQPSL